LTRKHVPNKEKRYGTVLCDKKTHSEKRTPKTGKPSALKREHPALQKMKNISFSQFFWVIYALLDPEPDLYADPDPAAHVNI
jgi:hypothetical protein